MQIFFFGDDQYSTIVLKNLLQKHQISAIITTPKKPKGKNQETTPNKLEKLARTHNKKLLYYNTKKDNLNKIIKLAENTSNSLGIIASFGHILPKKLIAAFNHSIINIHPSLLPQFRGATPVQHTLALGKKTTGTTIFQITPKIDQGKLLAQKETSVKPKETTPQLTTRLFKLANPLLNKLLKNNLQPLDQNLPLQKPQEPIYTKEFSRSSGKLTWEVAKNFFLNQPLKDLKPQNRLLKLRLQQTKTQDFPLLILFDLWRALTPWPGIWTLGKTKKGKLRFKILFQDLESLQPPLSPEKLKKHLKIHIAGKPNPISFKNFQKYYL